LRAGLPHPPAPHATIGAIDDDKIVATPTRTKHPRPRHPGTPEQRRRLFVKALLAGRSPEEALVDAGFLLASRKAIASTISSLRHDPEIKAILDSEERALRTIVGNTPAPIEAALSGVAFSDVGQLLNSDGSLKPIDSIAPEVRSSIKQLTISTYTTPDGSSTTRTVKVTVEKKVAALETLGERDQTRRPICCFHPR
jgi:hypothetical protein